MVPNNLARKSIKVLKIAETEYSKGGGLAEVVPFRHDQVNHKRMIMFVVVVIFLVFIFIEYRSIPIVDAGIHIDRTVGGVVLELKYILESARWQCITTNGRGGVIED